VPQRGQHPHGTDADAEIVGSKPVHQRVPKTVRFEPAGATARLSKLRSITDIHAGDEHEVEAAALFVCELIVAEVAEQPLLDVARAETPSVGLEVEERTVDCARVAGL